MGFLEDLTAGHHGVRFRPPQEWEALKQDESSAMLADRERQVGYQLGFYEVGLSLRPEDDETLAADVERHARVLFEHCYGQVPPKEGPFSDRPPRTSDLTWSPVIQLGRIELADAAALRVLHRLWYQPGQETVMGHLLIPVASGLIELRVMATDNFTGTRESVLLASEVANGMTPDQVMSELGQRYYDDPSHDTKFPDHVLSRVRAALDWLHEESGVEVVGPAPSEAEGDVVVGGQFAFRPPVRHRPIPGTLGAGKVETSRVSFAATDGVETLLVQRMAPAGESLLDIARQAASIPGTDERVTASELPLLDGRAQVRTLRHYERPDGPHHMGSRRFVDEAGWWVVALLNVSTCVSEDELFERTESVVRSYRVLDKTPPPAPEQRRRPWWKFW